MMKDERLRRETEIIQEKGVVTVIELCDILNVSKATVRRDLAVLDKQSNIKKTHGGAMLIDRNESNDLPISLRETMNKTGKERVAQVAIDYINEGDTIFIDSGSTMYEVATRLGRFKNLTILTNDINVAVEIWRNTSNQLIIIGGVAKKNTTAITGIFSEQMIANMHVNVSLVAADSVDISSGFMSHNMDEIHIKQKMIQNCKTSIMLCDHTKFEKTALAYICSINEVDKLITNEEVDGDIQEKLNETDLDAQFV